VKLEIRGAVPFLDENILAIVPFDMEDLRWKSIAKGISRDFGDCVFTPAFFNFNLNLDRLSADWLDAEGNDAIRFGAVIETDPPLIRGPGKGGGHHEQPDDQDRKDS